MLFQVTDKQGNRATYNASHVIAVIENADGCTIVDSQGGRLTVQESYRSVRGYMKKAYAPAAPVAVEDAE